MSSVANISYMFQGASVFNQDLSSWDTGAVTTIRAIFADADSFDQDIGGWDISSTTDVSQMFNFHPGLSLDNYDALLIGWSSQTLQPGLSFSATSSQYCAGSSARADIIATYSWTINDGGVNCSDAFMMTVDTTLPGSTSTTEFLIPTTGAGYNYDIDCDGDNAPEATGVTGNYTCTYATPGTYTISITGDFPRIFFNNSGDVQKLTDIAQWGTGMWSSMQSAFYGASNMDVSATDVPDLSGVSNMQQMFHNASSLSTPDFNGWDVSNVSNMIRMFQGASAFNGSIDSWDTGSVTSMSNMFNSASTFNNNIGSWDASSATTFASMFANATSFNQDISSWNTPSLTLMPSMFSGATSFNQALNSWDVSSVTSMNNTFRSATSFNQPLNSWDTSSVTNMGEMFYNADAFSQPIGTWDTSSVTNMAGMFRLNNGFNQPIGAWDTSNVTNMSYMFMTATAFDQPIGAWDTAAVTNMRNMFNRATVFNQPVDSWNVSAVTDMTSMFREAPVFNQDLNSWNTASLSLMAAMFRDAVAFNGQVDNWNVSGVTNLTNVFRDAISFNQPLNSWDVSSVVDMNGVFYNADVFNQPLNSWNTGSVTEMPVMFFNADAFNQDISAWDTADVTDFTSIFESADSFNQPLNSWDMSSATTIRDMFQNAVTFNQPLNNWDISNVNSLRLTFYNANSFNQDLSSWDTSSVTSMDRTFFDAASFDQSLAAWDMSSANLVSGMLDNSGMSIPNYDATLAGWSSQTLQPGEPFSALGVSYCTESAARTSIITTYSWTINDAGQSCPVPTVTNISSLNPDGIYGPGSNISIQVVFDEAVTVTGTPQLTLETGTTDAIATYTSGSGTNILTFTYTISSPEASPDLDYISTTALTLAGGSIVNGTDNTTPADLTLPAPGATGSLGDNKAIVVDASPPSTPTTAPDMTDSSDTGSSNTDNITMTTTPQLDVQCTEAGATLNIYSDTPTANTVIATHSCTSTGIVQVTVTTLADATHTLTYTLTDPAGNESAPSPTLSITIDSSAPARPTVNPLTDESTTITGTAEPGAVITITNVTCTNAPVIADGSGNYSCTLSSTLTAGTLIDITQTDDAGSTSPVTQITVGISPSTDSDNDGIPDVVEDANGNNTVDTGETDPNNPDTDNDGDLDGSDICPLDPTNSCDGDNIPTSTEDQGPNSGDANNDGTLDSLQGNVTSAPNTNSP